MAARHSRPDGSSHWRMRRRSRSSPRSLALIPALRPADWSLTALPRVASNTGMGAAALARRSPFPRRQDRRLRRSVLLGDRRRPDRDRRRSSGLRHRVVPLWAPVARLARVGAERRAGDGRARGPARRSALAIAGARRVRRVAPRRRARRCRAGQGCSSRRNPGLIYGSVHDLAEPLSAALMFGGLLAYAGAGEVSPRRRSGCSSSRRSSSSSCRWRSSGGSWSVAEGVGATQPSSSPASRRRSAGGSTPESSSAPGSRAAATHSGFRSPGGGARSSTQAWRPIRATRRRTSPPRRRSSSSSRCSC